MNGQGASNPTGTVAGSNKKHLRGVVLAGGTGSRLHPLTRVTNKHLLPVGRKPMIFHPIEKLTAAGVREILIVTGTEHMGDMVRLLGSGKDFGASFTFRVQDEAGGIAQALSLAETFAAGHPVAVLLGDNIFSAPLAPLASAFMSNGGDGAMIILKEVDDPERFGVAVFSGTSRTADTTNPPNTNAASTTGTSATSQLGNLIAIEEKPAHPKSRFAVTGIYFYDATVFDEIRNLKPSARGEYEITDVNSAFLAKSALRYHTLDGTWTDAGTHDSYQRANRMADE